MFPNIVEGLTFKVIQWYFGNYLFDSNMEGIKLRRNGEVELTNVLLKPEGLNALQLPFRVKAGYMGSVKIQMIPNQMMRPPVQIPFLREQYHQHQLPSPMPLESG